MTCITELKLEYGNIIMKLIFIDHTKMYLKHSYQQIKSNNTNLKRNNEESSSQYYFLMKKKHFFEFLFNRFSWIYNNNNNCWAVEYNANLDEMNCVYLVYVFLFRLYLWSKVSNIYRINPFPCKKKRREKKTFDIGYQSIMLWNTWKQQSWYKLE